MSNCFQKQNLQAKKENGEIEEVKVKPPMQTTVPVRPHIEWMSKALGREDRERILVNNSYDNYCS